MSHLPTDQHASNVSHLFLFLGLLTLLMGLAGCPPGFAGMAYGWIHGTALETVPVLLVIVVLSSALYFATGLGLMRRQSWARDLALVLGALVLFNTISVVVASVSGPIGFLFLTLALSTIGFAIGGYIVWALTQPEATAEFGGDGMFSWLASLSDKVGISQVSVIVTLSFGLAVLVAFYPSATTVEDDFVASGPVETGEEALACGATVC